MKINLIIAKRAESYNGEYAPEVLDAWDEYSIDENQDGYQKKLDEYNAMVKPGDHEICAIRVLTIRVPDKIIDNLFDSPVIEVEILK